MRLTRASRLDLPALRRLLHNATALDQSALPPPPPRRRPPLPVPDFLADALARHPASARAFDRLSPTCQREYIVRVSQAKRPETRQRRLHQTFAALAHGRKWAQRHDTGAT